MKYFSLLIVCFLGLQSQAQSDNKNLNDQLENMRKAFIAKDYGVVADFTYTKVLEKMGGKEKMIAATSNSISKMESTGFVIEKISFKDPTKFLKHNGDLQCAITQVLIMNTPHGKMQSESTIIAISQDDGENWSFLDSSGMPKDTLKAFYTNLHPDMEIKPSSRRKLD